MDAVTNNIQNLLLGLPGGNSSQNTGGLLSAGAAEGQFPFQSTLWAEGIAPHSVEALSFGANVAAGYAPASDVTGVKPGQAVDGTLYSPLVSFDTLQDLSDDQIAAYPSAMLNLGAVQPQGVNQDFAFQIGGTQSGIASISASGENLGVNGGTEQLSHFIPLSALGSSAFDQGIGQGFGPSTNAQVSGLPIIAALPAEFSSDIDAAAAPIRLDDILLTQQQTAQAMQNASLASRGTTAHGITLQNTASGTTDATSAVQIIKPATPEAQATAGQQDIVNNGVLTATAKGFTATDNKAGLKAQAPNSGQDKAINKAMAQAQAEASAQTAAQSTSQSATSNQTVMGQAGPTNGLLMSYGMAAASPALNNGQMGMAMQNSVSRDNFVRTLKAMGIDSKADISAADISKKMGALMGGDTGNTSGAAMQHQQTPQHPMGQTAAFSWQGSNWSPFADTLQSEQSGAYQTIASGLSGMRGDAAPTGFTASTPSQPNLTQQMMGQHAANQVALSINKSTGAEGQSFKVNLKPAELGVVKVSLNFANDGKVQATILAERPETLDLLKQDSRSIEKALTEAGHKLDKDGIHYDLDQDQGQSAGKTWAEAMQEDAHNEQQAIKAALNGQDGTNTPVGGDVEDVPLDDILPYVTIETGLDIRV